jgi:hypothetical protein
LSIFADKNIKIFGGGMRMKKLLLCAMLAGLIIPNAFADTITGTAGMLAKLECWRRKKTRIHTG